VTKEKIEKILILLILLLVLISDYSASRFSFFLYSKGKFDLLLIFLPLFFVLSKEHYRQRFFSLLLTPWSVLVFQILITTIYFYNLDGALIYSDDHPSFLYRLELLRQQFPKIPFYNPDWNGGYNAREFFATGVLNIFLLISPFLPFLPQVHGVDSALWYNAIIPYVFVILIPWSAYLSCVLLTKNRATATLAAILSLAPSMGIFEWILKYGTLGFSTAIGFAPLVLSLLWKILFIDSVPRWRDLSLLLISSTLVIFWTPAVAIFIPTLIVAIPLLWRSERVVLKRFALFFLIFFALNAPWMITFVRESKVLEFVQLDTRPGMAAALKEDLHPVVSTPFVSAEQSDVKPPVSKLDKGVNHLLEGFRRYNPLLLAFLIAGFLALPTNKIRVIGALTILVLVQFVLFSEYKPQFELRRMVLPLATILSLIAALGITRMINLERTSFAVIHPLLATFLATLLIFTPISAASTYANRTIESFAVADPMVSDLANEIKKFHGLGRTFFMGYTLHELAATSPKAQSGGHLAPLPLFTDTTFFANDYYHSRWKALDPIPLEVRQGGASAIEEFLDLLNISAVVTFHEEWKRYCENDTRYKKVSDVQAFSVYQREAPVSGYIQAGEAEIKNVSYDSVVVTPKDTVTILKFKYEKNLKPRTKTVFPAGEITLEPYSIMGLELIKLTVSKEFLEKNESVDLGFN
jgi:hypothetical protein